MPIVNTFSKNKCQGNHQRQLTTALRVCTNSGITGITENRKNTD